MGSIPLSPVKSSNVESVGYDADAKILAVKFLNGGVYHYSGVEPEAHKALISADSIGRHLGRNIIGKYEHSKQDKAS